MKAKFLLLMFFVFSYLAMPVFAQSYAPGSEPTVTTDKDDYAPGEIATFTGTGWTLDSKVSIVLEEEPYQGHDEFFTVNVNPDGTWSMQFPIDTKHLGVSFHLLATGNNTGYVAETYFTDAAVTFGATGLPSNTSVNVGYNVSGSGAGDGDFTSPSFTPPSNSTGTNHLNKTITVNSFNLTFSPTPTINYIILNYGLRIGAATQQTNLQTSNVFVVGANNPASAALFIANYGALVASNVPSAVYGSTSVTLSSSLYSNYQTTTGISGQSITFFINGNSVGSAPTDASGIATLNVDITNIPVLGNLNVGDYTITSSFAGIPNTYLPITAANSTAATLTVTKAPTTTVVTINGGPFTYTGSAIEPATVSVTGAGGLNLTPTADYANNVNAGTATASYSYPGDANYLPSNDSKDFTIGKATTTTVVTINGGPFTYTGSAIEPATVSVTGAGGLNLTPTADYANNINAGTATASYSYPGDDNYLPSNDSKDFTIGKATTTTVVTINGGPFTYTGSAIEPATVSVTGAGGLNL
ncbi:hypothetical protein M3O96_21625, partial [Aquiflexum sp. TKW24L]|uniref:hypothetical protein n=1 Tax=Aquiflexum sp. TKW24L TaxID=2942212 RepID=UPI0020BE15CC